MSRYFQQLLASSGSVRPATAALPVFDIPSTGMARADLTEVIEQRAVPFAAASSSTSTTMLRDAALKISPVISPRAPTSAVQIFEQAERETEKIVPEKAALAPSASVASAQLPPQVAPSVSDIPANVAKKTVPEPEEPEQSSRRGPSHDELIQQVFRWVGENPAHLVPQALARAQAAPVATRRALESSDPAAPQPTAPASSPVGVPIAPPHPLERDRTTVPTAATAVVQESSVEISIGTLEIQVEAPPSSGPVRRHPVRRAPAPGLPAPGAARPAIDLNRLRRGFYL